MKSIPLNTSNLGKSSTESEELILSLMERNADLTKVLEDIKEAFKQFDEKVGKILKDFGN